MSIISKFWCLERSQVHWITVKCPWRSRDQKNPKCKYTVRETCILSALLYGYHSRDNFIVFIFLDPKVPVKHQKSKEPWMYLRLPERTMFWSPLRTAILKIIADYRAFNKRCPVTKPSTITGVADMRPNHALLYGTLPLFWFHKWRPHSCVARSPRSQQLL